MSAAGELEMNLAVNSSLCHLGSARMTLGAALWDKAIAEKYLDRR